MMKWLFALCLTCTVFGARSQPADLALVDINASASTVIAMRHAGDGSGRLFLVERNGQINIFREGSGVTGTFLDISDDVDTFFEGGLQGLAFHPDYSNNGYFYVYYTRSGSPLTSVVERFSVSTSDPDQADIGSREVVFTLDQPAGNHNGGDIHFGPDGYLYIGLGDGGATSSTSQDPQNLLGKMLRIAPCANASCNPDYTIPPDNPFVGSSTLDEIWASGLRNPYRWSFDRDTGDLLIADVGLGSREEVSFQAASSSGGENYGWNCREGDINGIGSCSGTFVEPIITYPHTSGNCSITGGYRYRGCIAGLRSTYVFADFCTAQIWLANEDSPGSWSFDPWDNLSGSVYGFGEDEQGELYMSQGGTVSRFESASDCETPADDVLFADGFE